MSQEALDLTPLQQLVSFWRNRAEQLRSGAAAQPGRAELFDACAAQLAIAIDEVREASGHFIDRESLPLFDDPAVAPPAPPPADEQAGGDVIALAQARRRRPEQRGV
jgi:hypothetical protein